MLLLLSICSSGRKAIAAQDALATQINQIFSTLANDKFPGVAVLVRKDGRTAFERGYGVRDLRSFAKIDPQTNFRLASCTKQFTAMSIMLLVHDGKLRYDDNLLSMTASFATTTISPTSSPISPPTVKPSPFAIC